jgi:hypothetical protein
MISLSAIVGWIFLISSWIIPHLLKDKIKDDLKTSVIGLILASLACGVFVGSLLEKYF